MFLLMLHIFRQCLLADIQSVAFGCAHLWLDFRVFGKLAPSNQS